jgi:hypothetical protein
MTKYFLHFNSYGLVFVGRPLWREDGSVFSICCWPLPAQFFSDPCPNYCLRFETSLFIASYDSQGHGGGIWPRLHMDIQYMAAEVSQSQGHIATDGQTVCLSWCRIYLLLFDSYCLVLWRAPSLTRGRICHMSESVSSNKSTVIMYNYFTFYMFDMV